MYRLIASRPVLYALIKAPHFNWVVPFLEQHQNLESEIISFLPLTRFLKQPLAFADSFKQFPLFQELFDFHKVGIKRNKFSSLNLNKEGPLVKDSIIEYIENAHLEPERINYYRDCILQVLTKKEFKQLDWQTQGDMMKLFVTNYNLVTSPESIAQLKQLLQYMDLGFRSYYNPLQQITNYKHIDLQLLSLVIEQLFSSNVLFYKFQLDYHPILSLYKLFPERYTESDRKKLLSFFLQQGLFNYLTKEHHNSSFVPSLLNDVEEIFGERILHISSYPSCEDMASLMKVKLEEYQSASMPHKSLKKFIIQHGIYKAADFDWLKPLLSKNPELEAVLLPFLEIGIIDFINEDTFTFLLESPAFYELLLPYKSVTDNHPYKRARIEFIETKTREALRCLVIEPQQRPLLFLIIKDLIRYPYVWTFQNTRSLLKKLLPLADDELRNELLNLALIDKNQWIINSITDFERKSVPNLSQENQCSNISSSDCVALPKELWCKIASYLPKDDVINLSYSNKEIHGFFSSVRETYEFLHHVTRRNKIKVQEMLAKNNSLLFQKERVITVEGRAFYKVSAFQYAFWAADIDMWENMLKWITRDEQMDNMLYKQILELEQQGTYYKFKGKVICETHYDFSTLLDILDKINTEDCANSSRRKDASQIYLLGKVQKEFPLPLIHFFASHNYKSNEQCDTFFNREINQREKWCDSKYLGERFFLYGGSNNFSTHSGKPADDECKLRKFKDIFEYKCTKLKQKLGKQDCFMPEESFDIKNRVLG